MLRIFQNCMLSLFPAGGTLMKRKGAHMMDQKKTKGSQKPIVFAPSEEYPEIGLLDRIKQSKFGKAGKNDLFSAFFSGS